MNSHAVRVISGIRSTDLRLLMALLAAIAFVASCFSMAALYQDPFAHLKLCLGDEVPAPKDGVLVFYGHCVWCYMAVGLGLAALIAPPKQS
ncbi:MAG: hypothetical protein Q9M33_02315 [Robiginitomaculum sp.]|nr:hypothetical protein [Robiginitomaculum sp.]MDQ7078305.1 hypothetical protein [Robiginitomaculum sp.]